MSTWKHTIRLGDVWRNESMTFEQRRDAITNRIKASRWYRNHAEHDGELLEVVEYLDESVSPGQFDDAWCELYDIADSDRVWIDLYSTASGAA